jgi:hypothetical protein
MAVRTLPAAPAAPGTPRRDGRGSRLLGRLRPWSVRLACLSTLLVHLLFLSRRLGADEGGFAMVARHWRDPGPFLYGPQWVDRPPGLLAVFAVADHLGAYGVRLTAALLAVVLVAAVAAAAEVLGGRSAARWTAWAAFALASSVLLQTQQLNGELVAATCVAVSLAALARAVRSAPTRPAALACGLLAGAAATSAVLVKQDFGDALAFGVVRLGLDLLGRRRAHGRGTRRTAEVAAAFAAGAALVLVVAAGWASRHGGVGALAYAMFGFRRDAAVVLADWSGRASTFRLERLGVLALGSGLVVLLGHLAVAHGRRLLRLDPLPWALAAAVAVELVGVLAGGSYWAHYLIALVPTVALAAGLGVHVRSPGRRWTRRLVVAAALVTVVVSPVAAATAASTPDTAWTTGRWLAASGRQSDSVVVTFTHADVIEDSGLHPGYPYAWSLPIRTLDPRLDLLTTTLDRSAGAPTWVVRWDSPHAWGLDPTDRVDAALREHYRREPDVCGHEVWLHRGLARDLAPAPAPAACGSGSSRWW